jgi:hypothetical protein
MVQFFKASDGVHKYIAIFDNPFEMVKFGAFGYDDFTITNDIKQKKAYLARHRKRENWNNPRTAGALSRWILWNKPTLDESIDDYIKRFNMYDSSL